MSTGEPGPDHDTAGGSHLDPSPGVLVSNRPRRLRRRALLAARADDGLVQSLGEPSWQLQTSISPGLDALLFLRDALRLGAPSSLVPPTFADPVAPAYQPPTAPPGPTTSTATAGAAAVSTATAWTSWWRDQIVHDLLSDGVDLSASEPAPLWARTHPPRPPWWVPGELNMVPADRLAALARYLWLLDTHLPQPPHYVAVRDPVLGRAAQQLMPALQEWAEGLQLSAAELVSWEDSRPAGSAPDQGPSVAVTHRVAEEVAFDLRVPVSDVRVRLVTTEGQTPWWQEWAPGVLVCTRTSLSDDQAAYQLLQVAFRSHLRG